MPEVLPRARTAAHATVESYANGDDRPLSGYAASMTMFGAVMTAAGAAAAASGRRLPERLTPYEVALIAAATHRLSRLLTKAAVTSPLRAPFTRYTGPGGPSEVMEEPRKDSKLRHAIGELLTCPFCMDVWVVGGFGLGMVAAPRMTRMIAGLCTALSGADLLQFAYARAQQSV
jgi:hypothetical protein